MARTGTDAANDLADAKTTADVDRVFRRYLKEGSVPAYIATTGWWPGKVTIKGGGHTLELLVAPDYFAIGTNDDPLRAGKTSQAFAQEVADTYDSILPSQKLLRDIEAAASPKLAYIGVQKNGMADDSTGAVIVANDKTNAAFDKAGISPGERLTIGYRKSYVTRPNMNGDYLAIYGGRWVAKDTAPSPTDTNRVQPTSGHAHTTGQIKGTPDYADASHGITLVSRTATLDGEPVDLRDVFASKDPAIVALVSDEGRFDPVFPNAGSGSVATFSAGGGGGSSGGGGGSSTLASNAMAPTDTANAGPTLLKVAGVALVVAIGLWAVT